LAGSNPDVTAYPAELSGADFFIVTVPTPIDPARRPDLTALLRASRTVGEALKKGDIVVYESTVYPGATEEDSCRSSSRPRVWWRAAISRSAIRLNGSIPATRRIGSRQSKRSWPVRMRGRSTLSRRFTVRRNSWLAQGAVD